jgi:hypothetical protein
MKSESDWSPQTRAGAGFAFAAAILALGAWLRFDHIGGPFEQPDEPVATYVVAQVLSSPGFDTNWAHTQLRNETGPSQYNFSSYYLTLAGLERVREALGFRPPGESFDARTVFFRQCSAAFSVLALALAMVIARRIGGWRLALAAGLWVAVDPLLVQDSHYARPEAFFVLLVLCLVALALGRGRLGLRQAAMAGVLFGFLIACKVTTVLWFWLPLMACFPRAGDWRALRWPARLTKLGVVAAGSLAGFAAGAPRALSDLGGYLAGIRYLKNGYGGTFNFYSHAAGGSVADYVLRYLWATAGWGLACLFLVGLAANLYRRRWPLLLALYAPTLGLIAFMSTQHSFFERNLSHAVPLYLIGAGLGLLFLVERPALKTWAPACLAAAALAAAVIPAEISKRLVVEGFSGRFERERVLRVAGFLGGLSARPLDSSHLIRATDDDNDWFREPKKGPGPYVVLWQDVNPEITQACLARLHRRYAFDERATFPALFDDLPGPNTLRDYLGRTVRVLVFDGDWKKGPSAGP